MKNVLHFVFVLFVEDAAPVDSWWCEVVTALLWTILSSIMALVVLGVGLGCRTTKS